MAFRWYADDGPTLNTGLVSFVIFQGIWTSIAGNPKFLWFFSWGSDPLSPRSGTAHDHFISTSTKLSSTGNLYMGTLANSEDPDEIPQNTKPKSTILEAC